MDCNGLNWRSVCRQSIYLTERWRWRYYTQPLPVEYLVLFSCRHLLVWSMLSFRLQLRLICVKQHQRNIESIHSHSALHSVINSTAQHQQDRWLCSWFTTETTLIMFVRKSWHLTNVGNSIRWTYNTVQRSKPASVTYDIKIKRNKTTWSRL